jgi:murein DD-endopeptidase MepM/ murein hydrolase activator NlpD
MRMNDGTRARSLARAIRIVVSLTIAGSPWFGLTLVHAAASTDRQDGPAERVPLAVRPSVRVGPDGPFAVCPVDRPRHYADDFGAPRFVGGFHRHEGIDIFAPMGTPVRAPFAGRVERSSNWAGGLSVRIFGRHGFVYQTHLSSYGKARRVRPGDVVGRVGNTGDAAGGPTHDHFEWHPGGGPAVDPFRALNAACSGPWRDETVVMWFAE